MLTPLLGSLHWISPRTQRVDSALAWQRGLLTWPLAFSSLCLRPTLIRKGCVLWPPNRQYFSSWTQSRGV